MSKKSNTGSGLSLTAVLFVVFLVLKLTGNIDWSWWWVTSPLWIPLALALGIFTIILFVILFLIVLGFSPDSIKDRIDNTKNKFVK